MGFRVYRVWGLGFIGFRGLGFRVLGLGFNLLRSESKEVYGGSQALGVPFGGPSCKDYSIFWGI